MEGTYPALSLPSHFSLQQLKQTKRKATDKDREEEYQKSDTIKGKKAVRGKNGGHVLINEPLISATFITGSWM